MQNHTKINILIPENIQSFKAFIITETVLPDMIMHLFHTIHTNADSFNTEVKEIIGNLCCHGKAVGDQI